MPGFEFTIESDFDPSMLDDELRGIVRRDVDRMADRLQDRLRQRAGNPIPHLTGRSRRNVRVARLSSFDLRVGIPVAYARWWNNRRRYPRGRRNPNYQALQRAVQKFWPDVVRRVLSRAA